MSGEKLAKALDSKIRRDMLHILLEDECTVHQIADICVLSEVNASKHLKKLYETGLLLKRTKGRETFYRLKYVSISKFLQEFDILSEQLEHAQFVFVERV